MARRLDRLVNFMADPADHAAWMAYAKERRITMGKFIRESCNRAMGEERPDVPPSRPNHPPPRPPRQPKERKLVEVLSEKAKADTGPCFNRLPPGAFCSRCGKIHR